MGSRPYRLHFPASNAFISWTCAAKNGEPEPPEMLKGPLMKKWPALILFLILVVGGGLAIGFLTAPGAWYAGLAKPPFNPPDWLFAPVWTVLYVLIAIAGWRTFERDRSGWSIRIWWVQLVLNFLWSPVFFTAHQIGIALAVILLLLTAILAFIGSSWRQDSVAAWLFVPYAAWVGFASALNAAILALN
jgi:tryptophan-rich sensory protein